MNIRLYHPDSILENNTSLLSKEHTHYIVNVMRLKRGSNLNFFNKNGEWKSEIIFLHKDRVEVRFLEKIKEVNNLSKTELAICLVKKNPMDNILQKATELGVSKIIPIVSERSEVMTSDLSETMGIILLTPSSVAFCKILSIGFFLTKQIASSVLDKLLTSLIFSKNLTSTLSLCKKIISLFHSPFLLKKFKFEPLLSRITLTI